MRSAAAYFLGAGTAPSGSPAARLPLRANFAWTFAGNVVYAACQWGMLTALAKLGTPEMVGQFSLGLAVGAPIVMLANLQLRGVQATDARQEYRFEDYLALRLVTNMLAFAAIAGATLLAGYRRDTALVILALGVVKTVESLCDVLHGLLQQRERMDRIARSLMIRGPLALLALAMLVLATRTAFWGAVGIAAVCGLVLLTYDRRSVRLVLATPGDRGFPRPRWDARRLLSLAWLALPLGLVMMLISLDTNIPRYIIARTLGERELGIFAAMAYLQVAGTTVVGALGQSASPRLADHYARGEYSAFSRLLWRLLALGVALGAGALLVAVAFGRQVLSLLYRPEYAERPEVFVWLMGAAGVSYVASFLGYAMTAARCFRPQLPIYIAVAGATALGCLLLVPARGALGAAIALTVSSLANCGLSACVVLAALRPAYSSTEREA